ncbi:hypothetical protein ABID22_003409 [Pontibacter aydingkolensis]|uniref:DKNYY family protein n=1 Tax=Pontibacter aydingkolensis TaxID=1911536 RepID=A0ABS7CY78_9BACT|nr:hypothetical protein [Pontibacter aydingkolensis]MBW7468809.1 hypothetical protein [Pontibacter aydingkolensis]
MANAVQTYRSTIGAHALLYNGTEYYVPAKSYAEGHQFFQEKTFQNGSVLYDGAWFEEIPILYDILIDELVTLHPGSSYSQKLVKQKVNSFKLRGHTFVRFDADSAAGTQMQPGFYDMLYNGSIKVFARREKNYQERLSADGREGKYTIEDKFYLWKDGTYQQVGSKSSVLKVLNDEKKNLSKFARANKLKFRSRREEAILKIAQQYDALKN